MAIGMIMEFDEFTPDMYEAVRDKINWPDDTPDGVHEHIAGPSERGMRIVEVWDSREEFDRWMTGTVQPALQELYGDDLASKPQPRFTEFEVRRQESLQ